MQRMIDWTHDTLILKEPILAELVKLVHTFYETRRFITMFTKSTHGHVYGQHPSHPHPHTLLLFRSFLILSYNL
jgi:hypothetical protein